MTPRPRRSVLYMPGSNARAIEKARSLAADAVILDLEDSVAPEAKQAAREQVGLAVRAGGFGHREVVVRINALATPWGADDLEAVAAASPDAILIPKVNGPDDIYAVGSRLPRFGAPDSLRLWAMMETPAAVLRALDIAAAVTMPDGHRLAAFVLGTNDLAKETRARLLPGRRPMLAWLSAVVAAARAHGLDVIDGVWNDFQDEAGFETECREGRDLGMDGKTLIHPRQIEAANRVFAPSAEEVAAARKIIAVFDQPENRDRGAVSLDGRMVERLHADMARRTVALAEAIAAAG